MPFVITSRDRYPYYDGASGSVLNRSIYCNLRTSRSAHNRSNASDLSSGPAIILEFAELCRNCRNTQRIGVRRVRNCKKSLATARECDTHSVPDGAVVFLGY